MRVAVFLAALKQNNNPSCLAPTTSGESCPASVAGVTEPVFCSASATGSKRKGKHLGASWIGDLGENLGGSGLSNLALPVDPSAPVDGHCVPIKVKHLLTPGS